MPPRHIFKSDDLDVMLHIRHYHETESKARGRIVRLNAEIIRLGNPAIYSFRQYSGSV